MEIKAADVAKLRKMTGAGMMDCKKALVEAEGDFNRAQEIIREKGKLVAAKRSDRETSEGAVVVRLNADNTQAVIVCLGCETDFVSKNEEFQNLVKAIADVAIAALPASKDELLACKMGEGTVQDAITQQTGKSGEKHQLVSYAKLEAAYISSYVHTINGKLGAIVAFNKPVPAELGKGVAMQVVSMNPVSVAAADCPAAVVENERQVAIEKTKEEQVSKAVDAALKKAGINPAHCDSEDHIESNTAKGWLTPEQAAQAREIKKTVAEQKAASLPAAMIENIVKGRIQKFFKENTLEEQEYQMGDGKASVKETIAAADKDAKVLSFFRASLND
ncbi:MAG: elongation factor Ts [Bacteroidales bacterium]|nr:elongation factor Ts [Candidatus Egerieousia equi]MCQ2118122.1 translation elongation factor Ts [Bacteroidales bacterium]